MIIPSLALALLMLPPQPANTPLRCIGLANGDLNRSRTLNQPCYIVRGFITAHGAIAILPGTTVYFAEGAQLVIDENASLHAQGTLKSPVVFRGHDQTPGYWSGINFQSRSLQNLLSYAVVEDSGSSGSAVEVSPGAMVAIEHTAIRNNAGNGLYLDQRASLAAFAANRFEQDETPINLKAGDLNMLDTATTFTANKHNVVYVHFNDSTVKSDATWRALSVPYEFHTSPAILAHVTIAPGTRIEFSEDDVLNIEENGALTAEGTSAQPILFTGTQNTPGYWQGIYFQSRSLENILRHCSILYAGAEDGVGVAAAGLGPNSSATIQDTEIGYSQTAAIHVGQNAQLNTDAAASNRLHDNGAGIVSSR